MRRLLLIAAAGIVVLLVASQLLVPAYLEHRAEKRLTEKGGHAEVTIQAVPALRLLFDDGHRITVRGEGLHVDLLNGRGPVFDELDKFDQADVRLTRMSAGPFAVRQVTLARRSFDDPYSLVISASVTGRALSSYAGIRSHDGRPRIESVDGSVAGLSAGPLASAIAAAIADRL